MQRYAQYARRWAATGRACWFALNNTDNGVPPSCIADARALAAALRAGGVYAD